MAVSFVYLKDVTTLSLEQDQCTGCGTCVQVCPHAVFVKRNGKVEIRDRDACMECGACSRNCAAGAVTVRSGVGCAAAVINAALGRTSSSCCCVIESTDDSKQSVETPNSCGTGQCC
jgi:ferredoxin